MRWLLIALAFFGTSAANAQNVEVRSGEHADFSRLVIYLPQNAGWNVQRGATPTDYIFRSDRETVRFDVSDVFELIPRDRIADVTADGNEISLSLNCACEIQSQQLDGGQVVLDVSQRAPDRIVQRPPLPTPKLPVETAAETPKPTLPTVIPPQETAPSLPDPGQAEALQAFRRSLIEQIAQASTQDLLSIPEPQIVPPKAKQAAPDKKSSSVGAISIPPPSDQKRIRVKNAIDTARGGPKTEPEKARKSCYRSELFSVSDWGDGEHFSDQANALRGGLTNEFDRVDQQMIVRLARLYLYFGLGLEARNYVDEFSITSDRANSIRKLSRIIDEEPLAADDPLKDMIGCNNVLSLWAALAGSTASADAEAVEAITFNFAKLPRHLRRQLGPRMISALNAIEQPVAAQVIAASLERVSQDPTENVAESDLSKLSERMLRARMAENGPGSPDALAELLSRKIAKRERPDDADIELAASFSYELEGLEISQTLTELEIRALSIDGSFDAAYRVFRSRADQDMRERLIDKLISDVMENGADGTKATAALVLLDTGDLTLASAKTRTKLAMAMTDLWLPGIAERIVADIENTAERSEVTASAAAQQRRFADARARLDTVADARARVWQAEYAMRAGDRDGAWNTYARDFEDQDQRSRYAWFAGAWADVAGDTAQSDIARLLAAGENDDTEVGILTAAARDLEQSNAARASVEKLLQAVSGGQ